MTCQADSNSLSHKNKDIHFQSVINLHTFVRVDRTKTPLDMPYEGPYEILERITDRIYKLNIKGKPTQISTERLKPAFLKVFSDGAKPINFDEPTLRRQPVPKTYQGPQRSQIKKKYNS